MEGLIFLVTHQTQNSTSVPLGHRIFAPCLIGNHNNLGQWIWDSSSSCLSWFTVIYQSQCLASSVPKDMYLGEKMVSSEVHKLREYS